MTRLILLHALLLLVSAVGCVHYEYDLVRPEAHRGHIGTKDDLVVAMEPLEYRMRTAENRLVLRIFNPTPDAVELLGAQSSAVDQTGQAHPLQSQAIPPEAFIRVILPPIRPTLQRTGPTIGFGVVAGRGYAGRRDFGYPEYYYDEPRYYTMSDGNEFYWDWEGQTDVRLVLAFRRNGKEFRDEFVFHRVKV